MHIGGQGALTQHKMGSLQDLPHVDMMRPITKFSESVRSTERVADMISEDLVRGVQRQKARCLDFGYRIGDPVLYRLLFRECAAKCPAAERALAHELEGALHLAEPAHAVMNAPRAQPLLCDQEAVAGLA